MPSEHPERPVLEPGHSVRCHLCAGPLHEIAGFGQLARITSDCRPWPMGGRLAVCTTCGTVQKPADSSWRDEAESIYAQYAIYHQGSGTEQLVFAAGDGAAMPRSEQLLKRLFQSVSLPDSGRMIDIGCGNGGLLRSFHALAPNWRLNGTEFDDRHRAGVSAIAGVEGFFTGALAGVPGIFDLLTMVHVAEHIPNPAAFLNEARTKVPTGGHLLVEVPDWQRNPFDLLIADHCTHFSSTTLCAVAEAAGWEVSTVASWVSKELSLVVRSTGRPVQAMPRSENIHAVVALVEAAVGWLSKLLDLAHGLAGAGGIGIFGTSIAGTWVGHILGEAVGSFVDEDPSRICSRHLGRPVLAPADVPPEATVLIALAPEVAWSVVRRLEGGGGRYVAPPALD